MKQKSLRTENYPGYSLSLPREILKEEEKHPLLSPLLPLETGLFERAAGHGVFRRGLNEYVLIYCTDGRGFLELEEQPHTVERGTVLVCPPGISHRYWADPHAPWTIYWVHFKGLSVPDILRELNLSKETPCLSVGVKGELIKEFLELSRCFRQGHGLPHLYESAAALQKLFSRLVLCSSYASVWEEGRLNMKEILAFMEKRKEEQLSLNELSAHTGLSKYHLSRKFSEAMGRSPMAYFTHLKIQRACELLDTTESSVQEISQSLGFNTPYYFSEVFKRVTGYSPTGYRRDRVTS